MTVAAIIPAEVLAAVDEMQQGQYTYSQVEGLLCRYLTRRDQPALHGQSDARLRFRVEKRSKWRPIAVNDSVLERAELFAALSRLAHPLRAIIVLWYGADWSEERIIRTLQHLGLAGGRFSRRTLYRHKRLAVVALMREMNRAENRP